MPSNLKDYMNKNNITSSSRDSQQLRRPIEEERYDRQRNINDRYNLGSPTLGGGSYPPQYYNDIPSTGQNYVYAPKYQKSKGQCVEQLTKILEQLDRKDSNMRRIVDSHNNAALKKFNDDYDNLSQQIIRTVQTQLRENKERLLMELRQRRSVDLAECKPIRRNMDKLRGQVSTLRDGLHRQNQYRQYISRIVLKDFEIDLGQIQQQIDRLRLPNVQLGLDQKYYSCFKNDLNRVIVVRDQLSGRMGDKSSYSPVSPVYNSNQVVYDEINPHVNRDQIKRSNVNKNP